MSFGGQYIEHLIAAMNEEKQYLYMIKLIEADDDWFFFDMANEERPYQVIWVPNVSPAFKFGSEETVEEFSYEFLSPRKTEIVRIQKQIGLI